MALVTIKANPQKITFLVLTFVSANVPLVCLAEANNLLILTSALKLKAAVGIRFLNGNYGYEIGYFKVSTLVVVSVVSA